VRAADRGANEFRKPCATSETSRFSPSNA
jgi:hypothetical protein